MPSGCSQVSQRSTRRRLRVEQKALRHSVRGAVHLSMRRVLGMHRSSTTSALEPSASVISLCQSSSFGHAQSCTGCLASPQFPRSRNRSGEPRHDHPNELASRIQRRRLASSVPTRVREQCQSPADADETPHCLQLHRTVAGRFCYRSPLRHAANNDSILLTRIAAGASHDGSAEGRTSAAFLPV